MSELKVKSGDILNADKWNELVSKTSQFNIDSKNNVGIGTTKPAYKLHINGDLITEKWVRVKGDNGLYFQDFGGGLRMIDKSWIRTYGGKNFYHDKGIMRTDGELRVGSKGSRFIVNAAGKVGIGNTKPSTKLHIVGQLTVQNSQEERGWLVIKGYANNDAAKKLLDNLDKNQMILGGCWDDEVYFYWKDNAGRKRRATIRGGTF